MARKELWSAAKLAVRAYAHNPSEENSIKVAMAWKAIRDDSASALRVPASIHELGTTAFTGGFEQNPS